MDKTRTLSRFPYFPLSATFRKAENSRTEAYNITIGAECTFRRLKDPNAVEVFSLAVMFIMFGHILLFAST